MDSLSLYWSLKKKEAYCGCEEGLCGCEEGACGCQFDHPDPIRAILALSISALAAYMSWSCNVGMSSPLRVINALVAFLFGSLYVLLFIIFRWQDCAKLGV